MPHLPVSTTSDFMGKSEGGLYGDVIENIDWSVGEIMKALTEIGIVDNTLVIFTSDNGPWHNLPDRMLQYGVEPWHTGSAGLLHGAKGTTYEGGMRVPGILYWKGRIPPGQVSSDITTTLDIFPTLAGISGTDIPEGKKLDGYDILPFLLGNSSSPRSEFFYFNGKTLEAVREGQWKLRYKLRVSKDGPVIPELFNMKDDPGENYNLAGDFPEIVKKLTD